MVPKKATKACHGAFFNTVNLLGTLRGISTVNANANNTDGTVSPRIRLAASGGFNGTAFTT